MTDRCNAPFPKNKEVRCREKPKHDGDHAAEAEVIGNTEKWDTQNPSRKKVSWKWNEKEILEEPI
tara:strand:- start:3566 stop:3760 length:195 start_codon:yes stop_codon:yes gene_type:complete